MEERGKEIRDYAKNLYSELKEKAKTYGDVEELIRRTMRREFSVTEKDAPLKTWLGDQLMDMLHADWSRASVEREDEKGTIYLCDGEAENCEKTHCYIRGRELAEQLKDAVSETLAEDKAKDKEDACREQRKQVIKRLYALVYWFADEMLSEEEAEARDAAEFEREKAENPGVLTMRVSVHENNAGVMKHCMKAARDAANYLKNKENDIEDWQIAGINAMMDQCNKESIIPYDLPYAINGLLLQWDEVTTGAGVILEAEVK